MKRIATGFFCLSLPIAAYSNEFAASVVNDNSYIVSGGMKEAGVTRALAAASAKFDLTDSFDFFVKGEALRGRDGTADAGAIQPYSNIDAQKFSKLYEIWFEKTFSSLGLRIKAGKVDANSEFAIADHAVEFIHSSKGFSPAIFLLPTYPNPTASVNAFLKLSDASSLGLAVYSDQENKFDEKFYIGEWKWATDNSTLKLGLWHQTGDIDSFDEPQSDQEITVDSIAPAPTKNGTTGYYGTFEHVYDSTFLSSKFGCWFVQLATSDEALSAIPLHVGLGTIWHSTFSREHDEAGIGLSYVKTSKLLASELRPHETAVETFYRYQLNDHVAFKPDLQYIFTPAADLASKDALIVTLRIEVAF